MGVSLSLERGREEEPDSKGMASGGSSALPPCWDTTPTVSCVRGSAPDPCRVSWMIQGSPTHPIDFAELEAYGYT